MLDEDRQELELERSELDLAVVDENTALGIVDFDEVVAVGLGRFNLAAAAAQERLDSREQFLAAERFRNVVVGAGGEAADPLELLRAGGQHDHGDVREVADALERLVT